MRKRTAMTVLAALAILTATVLSAEPPTMQVRVYLDGKSFQPLLAMWDIDVVYRSAEWVDVFTHQEGLGRLQQSEYRIEVIHEDVVAFYLSQAVDGEDYLGFKRLHEIYAYLDDMKAAHPTIMTDRISIGQTIEGRDIYAVKISDNPDVDEDEPELIFNSLIHANEVMSGEVLLYFMDHLTDNYGTDPEATAIVDNREVWFVVVINPDGYYYNEVVYPDGGGVWRKNRRDNGDGTFGVDLNRNFGYMWAYDDYGSSPITSNAEYRGTAPFSEPETQALRDFYDSREFIFSADYHANGEWLIWPWEYDCFQTPDEDLFRVLVDSMATLNGHSPMECWVVNGCLLDWSYAERHVFSIDIEVGRISDGMWPRSVRIPDIAAQNLEVNLFLCQAAGSVYDLKPPARPVIYVPDGLQGPDYTVSWSHDDELNPAVAFELLELQDPHIVIDYIDVFSNWAGLAMTDLEYYYSEPLSIGVNGTYNNLITKNPVYVMEADSLKFWTTYELAEGYSYVYVEVSADTLTWERMFGNITTNDNPFGYNEGNGVTGLSDGWVRAEFDLSAYAGQMIWVRFRCCEVIPDPENPVYAALFIDDVELFKEFTTQTVIASDIVDTLWNFTDKDEGDYYYRVRAQDVQDQWGELSFGYGLVTVGTGPTYLCGDANGDGNISQLDVMYLIEYLHKDGPAPDPIEAGDANGDGTVDKFDAKYLIEYLHKDGPEPVCP